MVPFHSLISPTILTIIYSRTILILQATILTRFILVQQLHRYHYTTLLVDVRHLTIPRNILNSTSLSAYEVHHADDVYLNK